MPKQKKRGRPRKSTPKSATRMMNRRPELSQEKGRGEGDTWEARPTEIETGSNPRTPIARPVSENLAQRFGGASGGSMRWSDVVEEEERAADAAKKATAPTVLVAEAVKVDAVQPAPKKSWREALAGNRVSSNGLQLRYIPPATAGVVEFTEEEVRPSIELWQHTLVGAIIGTFVSYSALVTYVRNRWRDIGQVGIRGCCFGVANMILVKRMRETLYSSLLHQDISFFDAETVGDLTSRLGADCQQVSRVIGNDLNLISRNVLQGAGALIYLLILSWPLGLCTMGICSALATMMLLYGRYQKKAAKLIQEFTASANDVAQETISLMRTVRVYGTEKQEFGRYENWLGKLADISLRTSAAYGFWSFGFNTLYHSTQVIAVLIGGMSILSGHLSAEQLTKFILYSEWLIYSTWWVGENISSLMQSVGASEKVFQMMELSPSYQFLSKGMKPQKMIGHIDFVDVSFNYPSRETVSVLHHVSLSMHPNEVVAIVGLSGSGKSTMVNLLLRLYEPTDGQILIDGIPLKELDIKWLRERIGYVGQEPKLFRMDISSNIKYGCTRNVKQEDIEWAAKQAYAHDFILSLPNGYETLVDDDLLSGGQKQRIVIARAILRDPAILILDEATSALDAESEHNVKGILRSVRSDLSTRRTVIVIAHRLSTIQAADRIVVMDRGQIVEMGSHKELLLKDGLYTRLTKRQADAVV